MRILYYAPIIHTFNEMGPAKEQVQSAFQKTLGTNTLSWMENFVKKLWQSTERNIEQKGLFEKENAQKLHVFADSVVYGLGEDKIRKLFEDMSKDDSPMSRIILRLLDAGARIHGVEATALIEAGEHILSSLEKGKLDASMLGETVSKRDEVIAAVLDREVPDGENALLFIGIMHDVDKKTQELSLNFEIQYLDSFTLS